MSSCGCTNLLPTPLAKLSAGYTNGTITSITNISEWHESPNALQRQRKVKYFLIKNGYIVAESAFQYASERFDFAGAKHTPSVSTGYQLNFNDAYNNVKSFLLLKGILVGSQETLEIAMQVINGDDKMSRISNRIVLGAQINQTDCCEDEYGYNLTIGGIAHCATTQDDDCYIQQYLP
jgi:hypothetical protein